MRILQINVVYKKGSTGSIVYQLHRRMVRDGDQVQVYYGRGQYDNSDRNVKRVSSEIYSKCQKLLLKLRGELYSGCFLSTKKIIRNIEQFNPDIVHLHCLNGNFVNIYSLLEYLKENNISTVLTLHAEFMYTGGCSHAFDCEQWTNTDGCKMCPQWKLYRCFTEDRSNIMWKKMYEAFCGFDHKLEVVAVSPWLANRAKRSHILGGKNISVVRNGVDVSIFTPKDSFSKISSKYNVVEDCFKVVFVTASFKDDKDDPKGGQYLLELARLNANKSVKFYVVATNMLLTKQCPENVVLYGSASPEELAELYSASNVTVICSKRETYSMVVAESLCCGTPVIGFKAGGPESIAIPEFSSFVDYGDVAKLSNTMWEFLNKSLQRNTIAKVAQSEYAFEKVYSDYLKLYKKMTNSQSI